MKKMRVRIDLNGKTTIQVEGAAGETCREFTRLVEDAIGTVEKRDLTDDYYRTEEQVKLDAQESL